MAAGIVLGIGLIAAVVLTIVAQSRGPGERRREAAHRTSQGGDAGLVFGESGGDCGSADGGCGDGGGGGGD